MSADKLKVVAYLVSNLPSGEPGLCFEDERGDYGTEDFIPAFEALVRKVDLDAALERAKVLEADAERLDFLERTMSSLYTCTHTELQPCTDGIRGYEKVCMFDGWAVGMNGKTMPSPRAAIDAAATADKGQP